MTVENQNQLVGTYLSCLADLGVEAASLAKAARAIETFFLHPPQNLKTDPDTSFALAASACCQGLEQFEQMINGNSL